MPEKRNEKGESYDLQSQCLAGGNRGGFRLSRRAGESGA
jgi:hypothetical protein